MLKIHVTRIFFVSPFSLLNAKQFFKFITINESARGSLLAVIGYYLSGGKTMENLSILMPLQFLFYLMEEQAIVPISTFLRKNYRLWSIRLEKKYELLTIPLKPPNTIREGVNALNRDDSTISRGVHKL